MKLTRRRRVFALVTLVLGVVGLLAWAVVSGDERARSQALAREARARVHIGMEVREAEVLLGDAWHHAQCDPGTTRTTHLFLFGSRDLDETGVVILDATGPSEDQRVSFVGGDENYRLFLYDECSDLDLSITRK